MSRGADPVKSEDPGRCRRPRRLTMRHWITSFRLLTMRPNVRQGGGMARGWLPRISPGGAAARRLAGVLFACTAAVVLAAGICTPAQTQTPVDLQLVLAVDVSGSVNQTRFELQRAGYAAAFRSARVLDTIRSGPHQAIAVTMVQWTGPALQVHVVPWTRIADAESAEAFAAA